MSLIRSDAVAYLKGGKDAENITGEVKFYQTAKGVLVMAHVFGLPTTETNGFFGFHIHEGMECDGEKFSNTGAHYNPNNMPHPEHQGDLPPLLSASGEAYMEVLTDRFKLIDILGKTVVIHSGADDFHTQPAGNSGEKIACGVIGL